MSKGKWKNKEGEKKKQRGQEWVQGGREAWVLKRVGPNTKNARLK